VRLGPPLLAACLLVVAPALSADPEPAADPTPIRVAVLLPFVEDALGEVEGPFRVVAAVRRTLGTPVAVGVADLGSPHSPSFERLADERPQLVVGDRTIHAALAKRLGVGGAEVLLLDTSSIEATFAGLEEVGRRVGAADAMAAATASARARVAALALREPVPVLVLFGAPGSFLVVTGRSWLGDLLAKLDFANVGATGVGDERFPGLLALGDESLASLRPELVLLVAHGDPTALRAGLLERLSDGGPWSALRRSARRGVHVLDPGLFAANPGLAMPRAAAALVDLSSAPAAAVSPPVGAAP
jgi:iron complex transport system substrate-binding protein